MRNSNEIDEGIDCLNEMIIKTQKEEKREKSFESNKDKVSIESDKGTVNIWLEEEKKKND